jgi:hypothetical protein
MKNAPPVLPVLLPMPNYGFPRLVWRPSPSEEDLFLLRGFPGPLEFEDAPHSPSVEMLVMKAVAHRKLYQVTRNDTGGYDSYDSFVLCCDSEEEARDMHPSGCEREYARWRRDWVEWEKRTTPTLTVILLGEASEGTEPGVVIASFNAG